MAPRRGRLVRPLLEVTREETRDYCRARGLEWREDPSNADPRFARARVRHELLPALRELDPAAERTIAETARQLRDEAEVLDAAADEALARPRRRAGRGARRAARELPPALARLVLRRLAEAAAGGQRAALARRGATPCSRWASAAARSSLDLGGGLRAVAEYGTLRFARGPRPPAARPGGAAVPGTARFGAWEVRGAARRGAARWRSSATRSAAGALTVRALARRRPHAPGGPRRHQDAPGPVHRPQGAARAAPHAAGGGGGRARSPGWPGVALDERFAAAGRRPAVGGARRRGTVDSAP